MFDAIPARPEDPVLGMMAEFNQLQHPHKVNLGVGIYQGSKVFEAVQIAEKELLAQNLPKDYLPIEGDPHFIQAASQLVLGPYFEDDRHFSVQAVGGTSALSLGAALLFQAGYKTVSYTEPTWPNHPAIFKRQGFEYGDGDVILAQAACHNPTGIDPSQEAWEALFDKKPLIFFDNAYQGFGEGLEADVWPIREALRRQLPCLIATSFSKNFGLYGERVALLTVACKAPEEKRRVLSYLKTLIRTDYSNPPLQGARIVSHILRSPTLSTLWEKELTAMRERLASLRQKMELPGKGLFAMTGFTLEQVERLKVEFGIVMLKNGRINLSGLTAQTLDYVKDAFKRVS